MMTALRFDAATHAYTLDGVRIPSVTQLLEAAGLVELFGDAEQLAYARDRGTAVHVATELDDLGTLDESTVADEVWPYLRAWRKFRAEARFEPDRVEMQLAHPRLRYAGTIDRIGSMRRKRGLLDIKSGVPRPVTGVQLAGYGELAHEHGICRSNSERWAVHLSGDESYQLVRYANPRDRNAFMACLALYNWRSQQ